MHDRTLSSSPKSIDGQPRETDDNPEAQDKPDASETRELTSLDDTQRLEDLRSFATQAVADEPSLSDAFSELYEEEAFHLFTTAPLIGSSKKKRSLPRHLVIVGTMLLFLASMASPFALAGFNKAPVPASIADELEPPKLHPEIAASFEDAGEPVQSEQVSHDSQVIFDSDDVVTSERRRGEETPTPTAGQRRRASVAASTPRAVETREISPADEDRHAVGNIIDDVLGSRSPLEPSAPELPQAPTRAQVLSSLRGVSPAVALCGRDQGGRVTVDVTINGPTGRVSNVRVTDGADSSVASCVSRAVQRAQFPRFVDEDFRVSSFPFTVQ